MARLNIKWGDVGTFDKADPASPGASVTPGGSSDKGDAKGATKGKDGDKAKLLPLPIMVYISSMDPELKAEIKKVEGVVLKDERIALGCHFFRCVKLNGDFIDPKHPLAKLITGKKVPRIVLIPRDKSKPKVYQGKIKASSLYSGMAKVSDMHSKVKFKKYVGGMRKVLNDLDKLDQKEKKLVKDKKVGRAKPGADKDIEKLRKKIKAAEAKLTKKKFKVDPNKPKGKDG